MFEELEDSCDSNMEVRVSPKRPELDSHVSDHGGP